MSAAVVLSVVRDNLADPRSPPKLLVVMAVTRDDLLLRLAEMCVEGRERRVRGVAVAAALDWVSVLPAGAARDAVVEDLLALADRAVKVLAG